MKRVIYSAEHINDPYNVLQYIPKRYWSYITETDVVADFDNRRNRTVQRHYVYFDNGDYVSAIGTAGIKRAVVDYFTEES